MTAVAEHDPHVGTDVATEPDRPSARRRIGVALQVVTVVAAAAAITFGVLWGIARTSGTGRLAAERDVVLASAQQAAITLNTLDFHDPQAGLNSWTGAATGTVLDEFTKNRDEYAKIVGESKRVTTASATDAAVSELDDRAGIARVLVGVDVTVTPDGQKPIVTRQRLQLEMTRTADGWKVSKLAPVRNPGAAAPN